MNALSLFLSLILTNLLQWFAPKTSFATAVLEDVFEGAIVARAQDTSSGTVVSQGDSDFDQFEDEPAQPAGKPLTRDPLRGYNRVMFVFNDKFYFWLAKPAARGYGFIVPKPVRVAINRGFHNFRFPLRFVNCVLQIKPRKAGFELRRFLLNSTIGIGGLFDPADKWFGWPRPGDEDFGQTLGYYGVGDGFPFVLPLLGQTNLRDGIGLAPAFLVSPLYYVADIETSVAVGAGDEFNYVSLHIGEYESIKKDALDPYTFIRDAYKQNRDKKIEE